MQPSKVYYINLRTDYDNPLTVKLQRLIRRAGIETIDFTDRFVAIKIHFGEPGNLSFLRPNFARAVVDVIRAKGGRPFLTDCNTLYTGRRKNALDHLDAAAENGFSVATTGCQIIIADGLKGLDEKLVPIAGGKYVKEAKIGQAIMDADIFISLNHFKGHENTGFGGAMKNIGMGCGSRAGKMEQHCDGKPTVDAALCRGCRQCIKQCAHGAIHYNEKRIASIDHNLCVGCGRCIGACNFDAIENTNGNGNQILCEKIAEYSLAVLQNRPNFHINLVMQVSPNCDCHSENDMAIIPDVGMFASFDPVALDQACADACNQQPVIPGSQLSDHLKEGASGHDHFSNSAPGTDWTITLAHAEELGIGTRQYELITVK
ncbi:MAG: DUF362 domain-containing protein [Eubacteriales bacterium]|nr:DUF362 domain-containing protein [Eubacteriales bacterium]